MAFAACAAKGGVLALSTPTACLQSRQRQGSPIQSISISRMNVQKRHLSRFKQGVSSVRTAGRIQCSVGELLSDIL
jgi:hypothetical protein